MSKLKVKIENVYKSYNMVSNRTEQLLRLFSIKRDKQRKYFMALKNISFKVYEGETVGIIGLNGSGKSTLSNLIAKIIQPSSGSVEINGETSLIAISAGLNNNLSGIENIKLKCMMHGLTENKIEEIMDDIIEFADVGDHIHQPVKNYSSGMKSKLGFAISVHIDPDILIIDEALSVGDSTFTEKSLNKMKEFKERGKTIFFISHSASQVKNFCEKAIWVNFGELIEYGDVDTVTKKYIEYTKWFNSLKENEKKEYKKKMLKGQTEVVNDKSEALHIHNNYKKNFLHDLVMVFVLGIPTITLAILVFLGFN